MNSICIGDIIWTLLPNPSFWEPGSVVASLPVEAQIIDVDWKAEDAVFVVRCVEEEAGKVYFQRFAPVGFPWDTSFRVRRELAHDTREHLVDYVYDKLCVIRLRYELAASEFRVKNPLHTGKVKIEKEG